MSAPPVELSEEAVSSTLETVLSQRPFVDRDLTASLLERLLGFLRRLSFELSDSSPLVYWLTMIGLLAVLALLLWHIGYSLRVAWRALRRQPEPLTAAPASTAPDLAPLSEALARGDTRLAVELAWKLVQASYVFDEHSGLTPRQWVRYVRSFLPAESRRDLEGLLGLHEAACYAGVPPTPASAAAAAAAAHRLLAVAAPLEPA